MLKKILLFLSAVIFILIISFFFYARKHSPVYQGETQVQILDSVVEVYFDDIGVPHIYASNQEDAYRALGYVHAQDRLWQMELMRRIAAGRLSEIFGEKMLKVDKFFLGIGLKEKTKADVASSDTLSQAYKLTLAYLDGINAFIKNGPDPVEFSLIGIEKEPFTITDIFNVYGYMSFSFAVALKTDPLLTHLREKLGSAYINELAYTSNPKTTEIPVFYRNLKQVAAHFSSSVNDILKDVPVPQFIGSNSWVVGAHKTKNKKVILANDPHIAYAQPAVWYQSHIVTPDYELYGFNLTLTPFALLGHNREYAYGLTMFENDDIDLIVESETEDVEKISETIKVKDADDVHFEVLKTKNGYVVNDFIDTGDSKDLIAMDWVYTSQPNNMLEASYIISHSKSIYDFKKGASMINAPGLNMMYGDARNNIAWFAAGKLYKRKEGVSTKFFIDAKDNEKQFLDFDTNPQAINPPWNYVYSANNQPENKNGELYPGYYIVEDRAKRIVQLLKDKKDIDAAYMKKMIVDNTSSNIKRNLAVITREIIDVKLNENEKKALEILKNWKGDYKKELVAPTIYNKFLYRFVYNTFADEMGKELFDVFVDLPLLYHQINYQIRKYNSIWWDDITTKKIKENREEIFTKSFHEAISELETQLGGGPDDWKYKKVAQVVHKHTFDELKSLRSFFNVGPFETDGGNEVIDNQIYKLNPSGEYKITAGPSTRRIIDFSDVENSVAILPTGQSGNVFSKHYKDQAERYLQGGFYKMLMNKREIRKLKDKLILKPVKPY